MHIRRDPLRWLAVITMVFAATFGAHAQAAKVEGYWAMQLRIRGDDIPAVLDLGQDDEVIWGKMGVGHADFDLTGTLKNNEITLWIALPNDTLELKGELKGDVMEGSAATRDEKSRWSATRFEPPTK